MDLLPLFQWCEESGIGKTVRESVWAFAVIESTHLLSLVILGGTVLLVDLRILNLGLRGRSVSELARETKPFARIGLVVLILSGLALFSSEAVKCYYSYPFWVKMSALAAALIFTYTVHNRVALSADDRSNGGRTMVALVSLALWFVVAASGRWIGFSG